MKGCEHCNDSKELNTESYSVAAVLADREIIVYSTRGYIPIGRIPVRFCPACGSQLALLQGAGGMA